MNNLRINKNNVKKIAVLRANAIGDFIFCIPALRALKESFPNAELVYLGKPWHEEFLHNRKIVDRTIVIPSSKGVREEKGKKENKEELENFFKSMKKENFDVAFQMHGGGRYSNPFVKKLGAEISIGLQDYNAPPLDISVPYIYYQNEFFRYLELVNTIGAKTTDFQARIKVLKEDLIEASRVYKAKSNFIILHPGASDLRRRWPPLKFAEIGDSLSRLGFEVVVTGAGNDKKVVFDVISNMKEKALNLYNKASLPALLGLISKASLIVSNDTGPLHMAEAIGTPSVGIFWCGNMITASFIMKKKSRACISWTIHCPICKTDLATVGKPFDTNINDCMHNTSFVDAVSTEEVKERCFLLLREKGFSNIPAIKSKRAYIS